MVCPLEGYPIAEGVIVYSCQYMFVAIENPRLLYKHNVKVVGLKELFNKVSLFRCKTCTIVGHYGEFIIHVYALFGLLGYHCLK